MNYRQMVKLRKFKDQQAKKAKLRSDALALVAGAGVTDSKLAIEIYKANQRAQTAKERGNK